MGKISIIIPTYNRKDTILRAIDSALSQTLQPYEILVCDDGSTDNTFEIVTSLNNQKVKWIAGIHSGLPAVVRNRGIKKSQGTWLAFLDSDDWWEKDKLEKQTDLIKKTRVKAACTNAYVAKPHSDKKEKLYFSKSEVIHNIYFNELIATNFVICSSFLVEKRLAIACGGFPEAPALKAIEDYALWLRIATQTSFGYINEPLVYYTDDLHSVRTNGPQTVVEQKKIVYRNFLSWIKHKKTFTNYRRKVKTALDTLHQ